MGQGADVPSLARITAWARVYARMYLCRARACTHVPLSRAPMHARTLCRAPAYMMRVARAMCRPACTHTPTRAGPRARTHAPACVYRYACDGAIAGAIGSIRVCIHAHMQKKKSPMALDHRASLACMYVRLRQHYPSLLDCPTHTCILTLIPVVTRACGICRHQNPCLVVAVIGQE